jgi:hypothetical protein
VVDTTDPLVEDDLSVDVVRQAVHEIGEGRLMGKRMAPTGVHDAELRAVIRLALLMAESSHPRTPSAETDGD